MVKTKDHNNCSFCGNSSTVVGLLVEAEDSTAFICSNCVEICRTVIDTAKNKEIVAKKPQNIPNPREIYSYLNEHVIGQTRAKIRLSVEVSNHFQRLVDNEENPSKNTSPLLRNPVLAGVTIEKSNICLIGPSGSGKTLLANSLARKLEVPFAIGDATTLTEAGYVGEDVENLLLKLLIAADFDTEAAERGIIFIDEIDKLRKTGGNVSITRDVSGEGVQQSLLKMIEGTIANVPPQGGRKHPDQQCIQIDTTNILFIVGGAFVGLDDIIRRRVNKRCIGFGAATTENVIDKHKEINDLLSQVTGEDLVEYGLIPELVGRLPIVTPLQELSVDDMVNILTTPKNALLLQEQKKLALKHVDLQFTKEAIREIAEQAMKMGMGARALRSIVSDFMTDIHFGLGAEHRGLKLSVDRDVVLKLKNLLVELQNNAA